MASGPSEPAGADLQAEFSSLGTLSENIVAFCAWLREHWGFLAGAGEIRDALQAVEISGIHDPSCLRRVLRLVLCSKPEEIQVFDEAFDAFFLQRRPGRPQSLYAPRHTRQSQGSSRPSDQERSRHASASRQTDQAIGAAEGEPRELMRTDDAKERTESWQTLLGRYSPDTGSTPVPAIASSDVRRHLLTASKLVASVHLGHVRRWRPQDSGRRFDVRRTLRASLHTGGDPVALRFLGHPLRNPRFVVLIDGSRSMSAHGHLMLEFAYALVQRSRRVHVFLFSAALCEVTEQLRAAGKQSEHQVSGVEHAWGGGTRIGQSLRRFVNEWRRLLDDQTIALIYSDGFDVGDIAALERAMHELHRLTAGVIWVNPLVNTPGYRPDAGGMRASLPFIDALVGVREVSDLAGIAAAAAAVSR